MRTAESRPVTLSDPGDEARWRAVVERDSRADGVFFYSVRSTGVYCRPSCASRLPRRENVRFHGTCEEAEQAGFRPCRRCRPDQEKRAAVLDAAVTAVCRLIEDAIEAGEGAPHLVALAEAAGYSESHLHRLFRNATGVTPRTYAAAVRAKRMRALLQEEESVTKAIHSAGYGSSSRFYEGAGERLGMTPSRYRAGGRDEVICYTVTSCSLGALLVAATARGVCAIELHDEAAFLHERLRARFTNARLAEDDAEFAALVARVVAFVEHPRVALDLPLDVRGTAFQQRVWEALRAVPLGSTATYSEVAQAVGAPRAVRAVANACGANPVALAIPCHRIVRTDGSLGGYRGGLERKRELLKREAKE